MKPFQEKNGKLVACEGDAHTISTQLHLLPPSQKILILPALQDQLPNDTALNGDGSFNARSFVTDVDILFRERANIAQTFLRSSTNGQPRLVFMNGGSIAARTACISKISTNLTHGDVEKAEAIFNDIVKDGVAGLRKKNNAIDDERRWNGTRKRASSDACATSGIGRSTRKGRLFSSGQDNKRTTRADKFRTNSVDSHTVAGSNQKSTRSQSDPSNQSSIGVVNTHTTISLSRPNDKTVTKITTDSSSKFTFPEKRNVPANFLALDEQSESDSEDDEELDMLLSLDRSSKIANSKVVYGEACIVDVQSTPPKSPARSLREVKSEEHLNASSIATPAFNFTPYKLTRSKSSLQLRTEPFPGRESSHNRSQSVHYSQFPRTTFMKASETTIKKSPPNSLRSRSIESTTTSSMIRVFIDRGTDPVDDLFGDNASMRITSVFPLIEDLVVHFTNDTPDEIFGSVLRMYKDGSRSVYPIAAKASTAILNVLPDAGENENQYSYCGRNWPQPPAPYPIERETAVDDVELAVSSQSSDPVIESLEKFYQFNSADSESAIEVQNAFRAVLSLYFPASSTSYSQYCFPMLPEADRFWKSVWSHDQTDFAESKTMDQIIALGCDEGVPEDFFGQIAGQVEKLGAKRNGISRSGRLDIRYLIANAMQTFSTLPSRSRDNIDPTSNPTFLATILVPHLESYLATNDTRLLILTYTTPNLPVVLALRTILGNKSMKVTGIINSSDISPSSSLRRSQTLSSSHPLSNESTSSKPALIHRSRTASSPTMLDAEYLSQFPAPTPKQKKVSFSQANYLLPSTATDAELAVFLSTIWEMLMESSDFYTPEPEIKPIIVERIVERIVDRPALPSSPPLSPPGQSSHPPVSYRTPRELRQSGNMSRDSKIARLSAADAGGRLGSLGGRKKGLVYTSSNGSSTTIRTTASTWKEGRDVDGKANYFVDDDDSGDDAYDRMVLGRSGVKPLKQSQKAGKKKALKWLGLA